MKKFFVLAVLFILPLVVYLFFASGVNNFARLPVVTEEVSDVSHLDADSLVTFQDNISIVAFFGEDPESFQGHVFNLDQKILSKFHGFSDFQFVIVLPEEARNQTQNFIDDFRGITDSQHWKFVYGSPEEVKEIFESFDSDVRLNENLATPFVFIVDKELKLRGRDDDEDKGILYAYDSRSVSQLNSKMTDDVKVLLAEYRLALKKNDPKPETEL